MNPQDPRISKPHPHRSGVRCEVKIGTEWKHAPTRNTPEEAIAAAAEKLATLDAAGDPAAAEAQVLPQDPDPPVPEGGVAPPRDPDPVKKEESPRGVEGVRILGPYPESGGWRCQLKSSSGQCPAPMARTKAEALKLAERMAATMAKEGSITIQDALDAFLASKRRSGIRQVTLDGLRDAVSAFGRGIIDHPVGRLTTRTGQAQYDKLVQAVDPRTGKVIAVATHRAYLSRTKSWARWVVSKGWLRGPSPIEDIRGIGKRRRGKLQLTIDQTRQMIITCTEHASRRDEGAIAALMAVCMALRCSEVLSRRVEDIDDDGTHLRVCDHEDLAFRVKTDDSARSLEIPPGLRPILAQLATGKVPADPLFPGSGSSGRRPRQWLNAEVTRMCKLAGVPVVCPHSLRGAYTTVSVSRGVRLDLISDFVGHASTTMTADHYITPGVFRAVQLKRGMESLTKSAPLPS